MRAIVWTAYGPPEVLQLREVPKPSPKDSEVLIRVRATTVTAGDCEFRRLALPVLFRLPMQLYSGIGKPERITILGQELAGDVESVGKGVKLFREGDQVFGTTGFGFGAYAEYACLPEDGVLATKPSSMGYDETAALPTGGLEALHFIRTANIQSGQKVLIIGAGGSIGTYAVQLAKLFGADVTGVDSTSKLAILRSIGADQVIDYTQDDPTKGDQTYDVILDVPGKSSFSASVRSLRKNGRYLLANPGLAQMIGGRMALTRSSKKVIFAAASRKAEDLVFLRELIEAGKIKSVIDTRYPLEQTAEAHRYVETGQKMGNVIITV